MRQSQIEIDCPDAQQTGSIKESDKIDT